MVYLRYKTLLYGPRVCFVAAKTRVTPINGQTIPRLELLSALLLARLIVNIFNALKPEIAIGKLSCYTDSRAVLHWITATDKEWRQFVQNRVNQIRNLVSEEAWAHCPGAENPADIPSRGTSLSSLLEEPRWLNGPAWLSEAEKLQEYPISAAIPNECL